MPDTVVVFAYLHAKPGQGPAVRAALERCQGPTREEPGCEIYDLHVAVNDPDSLMMYEIWQSEAALERHRATPHLEILRQATADLLAEPNRVMVSTRVS